MKLDNLVKLRPFTADSIWRLFIDYNRQQSLGPLGFDEKEPGYLQGMYNGLNFLLQTIEKPLTADLLVEFQRKSVSNVSTKLIGQSATQTVSFFEPFYIGIRDDYTEFGLVTNGILQNTTANGMKLLLDDIKNRNISFEIEILGSDGKRVNNITRDNTDAYSANDLTTNSDLRLTLAIAKEKPSIILKKVQDILNQYQADIINALDDEKITYIAKCIHRLEVTHPFADGNCRSIVMLLLNRLLLENGFSWCLLENPNRFDAYSIDELKQEIYQGMRRFREFTQTPTDESEPFIYLDTEIVRSLIVLDAAENLPSWNNISATEKNQIIQRTQKTLENIKTKDDPINIEQLSIVKSILTRHISENVDYILLPTEFLVLRLYKATSSFPRTRESRECFNW